MPTDVEVCRVEREQDASEFARIVAWSFSVRPTEAPRLVQQAGVDNVRIVRCGGAVAGGLFLLPMGQWFGGRSVSMTGVAAVAIAPEFRGRGLGGKLMRAVVRELASRQVALSTLYPAVLSLYRSVGYEPAGSRFVIRMRPEDIGISEPEPGVVMIRKSDEPQIEEAYRHFASAASGYLDRSSAMWARVRQAGDRAAQGFVVRGASGVEGYLYALQTPPDERGRHTLRLTDLVALTPEAGRNLLAFLAGHRSLAAELVWHGGASGSLLSLLPQPAYRVSLVEHFATRVVDVQLALSTRGYPALDAELGLQVIDPLLKHNQDRFLLEVAGGVGTVRRAGSGALQVHVRGLAPLLTGFLSPCALRRAGLLQGSERALATAAALFSGPAPSLPDTY